MITDSMSKINCPWNISPRTKIEHLDAIPELIGQALIFKQAYGRNDALFLRYKCLIYKKARKYVYFNLIVIKINARSYPVPVFAHTKLPSTFKSSPSIHTWSVPPIKNKMDCVVNNYTY